MNWEFDENGFVKPYTCIPISMDEFKEKFRDGMTSERRYKIFDQYQILISKFKAFAQEISFYQ